MAAAIRFPAVLRGAPLRFGFVLALAGVAGGYALWSPAEKPAMPPSLAMEGKSLDRLSFSRDESEIPVRDARIFDTLAMFAQPQAEPRAWSQLPVVATVQEAGIRPIVVRSAAAAPKVGAVETPVRPVRTAAADTPSRSARAKVAAETPVTVFGWDIPGSQHLPSRRDASRAFDAVGNGVVAAGSGGVRVVTRTASIIGDGVKGAGGALLDTLGID